MPSHSGSILQHLTRVQTLLVVIAAVHSSQDLDKIFNVIINTYTSLYLRLKQLLLSSGRLFLFIYFLLSTRGQLSHYLKDAAIVEFKSGGTFIKQQLLGFKGLLVTIFLFQLPRLWTNSVAMNLCWFHLIQLEWNNFSISTNIYVLKNTKRLL